MFDVSFSELMVIAVVALLVIGPEKLPKVARTLGALIGRMQRYVAQVKEEVNREVRFEELQQLQQEIKESVATTQANFQKKADVLTKNLTQDLDFQDTNTQNLGAQDTNIQDKEASKTSNKKALNKV